MVYEVTLINGVRLYRLPKIWYKIQFNSVDGEYVIIEEFGLPQTENLDDYDYSEESAILKCRKLNSELKKSKVDFIDP